MHLIYNSASVACFFVLTLTFACSPSEKDTSGRGKSPLTETPQADATSQKLPKGCYKDNEQKVFFSNGSGMSCDVDNASLFEFCGTPQDGNLIQTRNLGDHGGNTYTKALCAPEQTSVSNFIHQGCYKDTSNEVFFSNGQGVSCKVGEKVKSTCGIDDITNLSVRGVGDHGGNSFSGNPCAASSVTTTSTTTLPAEKTYKGKVRGF